MEEKRFLIASKVAQDINSLARQRPGDNFTSIGVPSECAGRQCYLCVLGNECLGPSCLGYSGKFENQFELEYQFIETLGTTLWVESLDLRKKFAPQISCHFSPDNVGLLYFPCVPGVYM